MENVPTKLKEALNKNLLFYIILTEELKTLRYGQMTVNTMIKNSKVDILNTNITKTKRKRY